MAFPENLVEWIATGVLVGLVGLVVLFLNVLSCRDDMEAQQVLIREQLDQIKRRANQARDAAQAAEATANEIKETLNRIFRLEEPE